VNAFVHRDYAAFEGGMSVGLYPNRLVIWNSGDLPEGIRIGDLKKEHPSILRNPDISHVFYLRRYMERVGRGTQKIIEECRAARLPAPKWEAGPGGVTLTLFAGTGLGETERLNLRQRKLLKDMQVGTLVKTAEYCELLAVSERQGRRDLMELEQAGFLDREGEGPATVFRRTEAPWKGA
jgi:ATP-dependent DNA helicase RecG